MLRLPRFTLTPRGADVLTAAGLLLLMGAVSITAPHWARLLRQPLAAPEEEPLPARAEPARAARGPEQEAERKINVKLYFEAADGSGLVSEERAVPFSNDLAQQVRLVAQELIRGSATGLGSSFAPEGHVLEVFVSARGIAYVDLSQEATASLPGGSRAELLAVYALVNSVTANFPSIKRVQILLDDRPVSTLSGHVDLSRPLPPDMTFLAPVPLAPPSPAT